LLCRSFLVWYSPICSFLRERKIYFILASQNNN
jgi:hypothetical protein